MKSMTGFARAVVENGGHSCTVEIRTVNHRFCEISLRLPRQLQEHEATFRKPIADALARGSISVAVSVDGHDEDLGIPVINAEVSEGYLKALRAFQKKHRLSGEVAISDIATLPELFTWQRAAAGTKKLVPLVKKALAKAVDQVDRDRQREGAALARECKKRIVRIQGFLKKAEKRGPVRTLAMKTRYQERIASLSDSGVDPGRLAQELAILADRLDFTEECVRLSVHTEQFLSLMQEGEPLGRRLNFLLQEMGRESNTIGSKANDPDISALVVEMKEEIEKLREQVQNVE